MSILLSGLASCTGVYFLPCTSAPSVLKAVPQASAGFCLSAGAQRQSLNSAMQNMAVCLREKFSVPACVANTPLCCMP